METKPQIKSTRRTKPKVNATSPQKTSSRDNFTKDTIDKLRRRAGNLCSNPECHKQTSEPQFTNDEKTTDTGIAAHICAAASNGPRYDNSMSEKDRKHISNAIWLCSHCATKIDRESAVYSVQLLKQWKKIAENRLRENSNKKLYTEGEVNEKVTHSMFQSMGLNIPEKFKGSLTEIAKAINEYIRKLDPRVEVNYSYNNGCNHFEIRPTELSKDDPISFKIIPSDPEEHRRKLEDLFRHGKTVTFEVNEFTSNSDGLNLILPQKVANGRVTLDPSTKIKATVEIQDSDENTLISLEDNLFIGDSTFSFESQKYDGLVKFKIDKAPILAKEDRRETTMILNFQVWQNQDLLILKYFDQAYKLYKNLSKSDRFFVKIYVDGNEIFKSKNKVNDELFEGILTILHYTHHCRELCKILRLNICFDSTVYFIAEEHQQIYETVQKYEDIILTNKFTSEIAVQTEELQPLEIFNKGIFSIERGEEIKIDNIFNQKVSMIIFVQHIFSKVRTTTTYKGKNIFHSYNLKLDNSDQLGSYTRTTSLRPKYKTLDQV
jgi:ribosomal protein L37AE/L43A